MVKNPTCNAGDTYLIPGLELAPGHRATKLMSTTTESRALGPTLHEKRSHRNEKPIHCNWRVDPTRHN